MMKGSERNHAVPKMSNRLEHRMQQTEVKGIPQQDIWMSSYGGQYPSSAPIRMGTYLGVKFFSL